jgi:hypothetical protein
MSSELEGARAMVVNLELLEPMVLVAMPVSPRPTVSEAESPSSTWTNPQRRSCFRSLRLYVYCLSVVFVFVTLGFADMT